MIGEIIEATSIRKGKDRFEIIQDTQGPETISINRLEIVPLVNEKIPPRLTWAEFFGYGSGGEYILPELGGFALDVDKSTRRSFDFSGPYDRKYWDVRDRAREMDAHLGIQHARCLAKMQSEIPKEWLKYRLLFPGTTLRSMKDGKLYLPMVLHCDDDPFLLFEEIFFHTWDLRKTRFLRWRR